MKKIYLILLLCAGCSARVEIESKPNVVPYTVTLYSGTGDIIRTWKGCEGGTAYTSQGSVSFRDENNRWVMVQGIVVVEYNK